MNSQFPFWDFFECNPAVTGWLDGRARGLELSIPFLGFLWMQQG
jgi:hypothetical protein